MKIRKNCNNCKYGYFESSCDGNGEYFVCEKRDSSNDQKLEENLGNPDYLLMGKVCCELKPIHAIATI